MCPVLYLLRAYTTQPCAVARFKLSPGAAPMRATSSPSHDGRPTISSWPLFPRQGQCRSSSMRSVSMPRVRPGSLPTSLGSALSPLSGCLSRSPGRPKGALGTRRTGSLLHPSLSPRTGVSHSGTARNGPGPAPCGGDFMPGGCRGTQCERAPTVSGRLSRLSQTEPD